MSIFTKLAQQIFASTDEAGIPRSISEQEVGVWGTEVENAASASNFSTDDEFADARLATAGFARTAGNGAVGNGRGSLWKRMSAAPLPVMAWHKQIADGSWWELPKFQVKTPEMFGAQSYSQAELEVLDGAASIDVVKAKNTIAFQNAIDFIDQNGGGFLIGDGQIYVLDTTGLLFGHGVYWDGAGTGEAEPIYPGRQKTYQGTTLLFKGDGVVGHTFAGITSMKNAGGRREDPDNPGTYINLFSAMNDNAADTIPATQRQFSVAIRNKVDATYWGVSHTRIMNWCGQNGIEGHSDQSSTSLGDDWDFGLLLDNTEYADINHVQVMGGWREAAFGMFATAITNSRSERNSIKDCKFQGRVGVMIRAPDRWACTPGAGTIQLYYSNEHYFGTTGTVRGSNNTSYSWTGKTKVGTALTLTGVTPDPAASGIFHIRHAGAGFANCEFVNVLAYGLDHVSGQKAPFFGLADSRALEVSGYPLRGIEFRNFKAQTFEKSIAFFHDCQDFTFFKPQFEGGGHIIASPVNTAATYAVAPVGETRGLVMFADQGTYLNDLRLFLPRDPFVQSLMMKLYSDLSGNFVSKPQRSGQHLIFQDGDAAEIARTQPTAMLIGTTNVTSPGAGNALKGISLQTSGLGLFSADAGPALNVNRNTDDGVIVNIRQDGTIEGSITIAGTTVAYNTFCGAHWSQLADGSTPEILRGTVVETIDARCNWYVAEFVVIREREVEILHPGHDETQAIIEQYEETVRLEYRGGQPAGSTVTVEFEGSDHDAVVIEEANEQLPRFKISETAGSKRVYGVFMDWDDGDAQIAAIGAYLIRIAGGETITGGDYLESDGDGCARVQSDDLLRSSTIAKVSSTEVVETYPDGSYLVPCTLHCG